MSPVTEMTVSEQMPYRSAALQGIVNQEKYKLVKTHWANCRVNGFDSMPSGQTEGAIYIVRDPRDVVLSYSRHMRIPVDDTVVWMCNTNATMGKPGEIYQRLGTWSEHVKSWTKETRFPVLVIRYEDMKADPVATFGRVLERLGLKNDPDLLERSIHVSSMSEIQRQEDEKGFNEKEGGERFFGDRNAPLKQEQQDKIERYHREVMEEFGYLNG